MRAAKVLDWGGLIFCAAVPVSIAGLNLSAALVCAAVLMLAWREKTLPLKRLQSPVMYALCVYLAVGALSAVLGVSPAHSVHPLAKDLHKLWMLSLLLCALPRTARGRMPLAMGVAFASLAVFGVFQGLTLRAGDFWLRAHGFVHPVTYGEQMGLGWLGALCWFITEEKAAERRYAAALLAFMGVALIFNQTRGALLGVGVGFAALCLVEPKARAWAGWTLAGAVVVLGCWELLPTGRSIVKVLWNFKLFNAEGQINPYLARYSLWSAAWGMFKDHPWTGVGPGNYGTVFMDYFHGTIDGENVWGSAHNLYLHQLAERGAIGLAALAALFWTLTRRAYERVRQRADAWNLWAFAAMAAFMGMSLTEVAFQNEQVSTLLLLIWALGETGQDPA